MDEQARLGQVRAAQEGDPNALQRLIVEYHPVLHRRLMREARRQPPLIPDIEDILQDAYIAAFQGIKGCSFDTPAAFYRWIETITLYCLKDRKRASLRKKRDVRRVVALATPDRTSYMEFSQQLLADVSTPSRQLGRAETVAVLLTSLARLSDDQRNVVLLRFLEGLSVAEIAERLGKTEDAIHALCRRGLKSLRELMGSLSRYA